MKAKITSKKHLRDLEKEDNWIRCPECRHKLFKKLGNGCYSIMASQLADGLPKTKGCYIEIKCHSCKNIVNIKIKEAE